MTLDGIVPSQGTELQCTAFELFVIDVDVRSMMRLEGASLPRPLDNRIAHNCLKKILHSGVL